MARSGPLLTEAQWKKIAPLLPKPPKQRKGGRPWIENRRVLEGILWILRSGARWQDLPEKFPHPSTCWRRLRDWEERGVWLNIWRAFLSELNERQQLKWSESFLDGSFAPAKKGAAESEKPSGAIFLLFDLNEWHSASVKNRERPPKASLIIAIFKVHSDRNFLCSASSARDKSSSKEPIMGLHFVSSRLIHP